MSYYKKRPSIYIFYDPVHIRSIKFTTEESITFSTIWHNKLLAELVTYVLVLILDHIQWMESCPDGRYFEAHISECDEFRIEMCDLRLRMRYICYIFIQKNYIYFPGKWELMSDNYDT